ARTPGPADHRGQGRGGAQPADARRSRRGDPGPDRRGGEELRGRRVTGAAPLRAGVAGAGVMGRNHARVLAELKDFELVAVLDPDEAAARAAAEAWGAAPVATVDAFLGAGLDCAVIATPNRTHADLGVALLEAGVHVLVEKPIAATVADARRMIDAAKANERVLMVGQVERFNPAVEAVKRAID